MFDFSQLLLYVPGAVIFLVGSGRTRGWLRRLRGGGGEDGVVRACEHVVRKDGKDRDIMNFYNVTVEYTDSASHHKVRQSFKSPTEYALSQPVRVYRGSDGRTGITEKVEEDVFHPLTMMILGALLILLALFQNQGKEPYAMGALSASLLFAGGALIWNYIKLRGLHMETIEGTITDVYTRQISRGTKILRGDRFTYYPIVRYEIDGKESLRRCLINSSREKTFRRGDPMKLYYEPSTGAVREKGARPAVLAGGIVLIVIGILAGLSILSVIL